MTRWHILDGPKISPLEALARIADAPVIALLHGSAGASLAWHEIAPTEVLDEADQNARFRGLAHGGELLARHLEHAFLPADPRFGKTWCDVPPESWLVQCDYEFPAAPPRFVAAQHLARWDADGHCTLLGPDQMVLAQMAERLAKPGTLVAVPRLSQPFAPAWDAAGHQQRIARIKDLIAAGDCYQVNLAVPFRGCFAPDVHRDIAAFQTLITHSPAPFAAFFRTPERPSVISHSPENLLSVRGDHLVSVPIKGTRRRVAGAENQVWAELCAAAKDDAELAMIVDLVRNDLGRVAVTGSVAVTDRAQRIDLPYVIHRAARIEARLRPGLSLYDALMAVFPAGSITGAPKRRVRDIITELEDYQRGAYCGTFGWIGPGGADLAVAIRTAEIDGNDVIFHAGGGVVWDSDPAAEWDEVRAKASGLATAWGGTV